MTDELARRQTKADAYHVRARAYAQQARAANTRRAYAADAAHFSAWAEARGVAPLPASAGLVLAYLMDEAERVSVATLERRLVALRLAHRERGFQLDTRAQAFVDVWRGLRRTHGAPQTKKDPLTAARLKGWIDALPATTQGVRDRALLLVGFAAGLRRSELVALRLDADAANRVEFVPEGLLIRLGASKTDQEGRGAVIALPHGKRPETCPVSCLRLWIATARLDGGALFRAVSRGGRVLERPLCDRSVALIVKRAVFLGARAEGADEATAQDLATRFAGHSLRAGLATSAAANDAPGHLIQRHLRHAKFDTTLAYIREGERFKTNVVPFAGL